MTAQDKDWIVVLADGETWTDLGGCKLMRVPTQVLDLGGDADDLRFHAEEEFGAEIADAIEEYDLSDLLVRLGVVKNLT
jgi:hypothetical protein